MLKSFLLLAAGLLGVSLTLNPARAADTKPLRVLLITGGCCHDYTKQKDILKKGVEARANAVVDQIHTEIPKGTSATQPPLPIYGNPDYAKGYDVVIHDECAADISDPAIIKGVLAPHSTGIPGVNLHCAMHCYRIGNPNEPATPGSDRAMWFDYLGIQSSGHGAQLPIAVRFTEKNQALTKGLGDWTTINEELYNNIQIFPTAKRLALGSQITKNRDGVTRTNDYVVAWANEYQGIRVFSTTLGHNNATVADARYLDLVTRGLLWACRKLDDQGNIKPGYGPQSGRTSEP
jgi:hypothetical protein